MSVSPIIVWFRRDLRLSDNPALYHAAAKGAPVLPLYIDETDRQTPDGAASRVWLHHSLKALSADMDGLVLRKGAALQVLKSLIDETGAKAVYWNRRYGPDREIDTTIKSALADQNLEVKSFNGCLLSEPWTIKPKSGAPYYKVYTPYWRAVLSQIDAAPALTRPEFKILSVDGLSIDELIPLPNLPDWASKMLPGWTIGEHGAKVALRDFLDQALGRYASDRDRPDRPDATSRLSPHLAFGEISPRQIWHKVRGQDLDGGKFLSEIGWRDFSYNLLFHNPELRHQNFKSDFDRFPWISDSVRLKAWQTGQTGYPIVDAGMRELWETGYQHNRVRMITASFLIKHLMIDWREGEKWFWDTLFDADVASNPANWQWVAGSGADASPFFRIFNPMTQGQKFDPKGDYVRRWVPELTALPDKYIHSPWTAPDNVLNTAEIKLGEHYPNPIVDHKTARLRALEAYKSLKE